MDHKIQNHKTKLFVYTEPDARRKAMIDGHNTQHGNCLVVKCLLLKTCSFFSLFPFHGIHKTGHWSRCALEYGTLHWWVGVCTTMGGLPSLSLCLGSEKSIHVCIKLLGCCLWRFMTTMECYATHFWGRGKIFFCSIFFSLSAAFTLLLNELHLLLACYPVLARFAIRAVSAPH